MVFLLFGDLGYLSLLVDDHWLIFLLLPSDIFHQFLQSLYPILNLQILSLLVLFINTIHYYYLLFFHFGFAGTGGFFRLGFDIFVINTLLESFVYT